MKSRALLLLLILSGCSTIKQDAEFHRDDEAAFVLIAADGIEADGVSSYHFNFRAVDLGQSMFLEDGFSIDYNATGPFADELKKPKGLDTSARYAGAKVPPGYYALYRVKRSRSAGMQTFLTYYCGVSSSPVFKIDKGQLNLVIFRSSIKSLRRQIAEYNGTVLMGHAGAFLMNKIMEKTEKVSPMPTNPNAVLSQAQAVLDGYVGITAPSVLIDPVNFVSFEDPDKPFRGRSCNPREDVVVLGQESQAPGDWSLLQLN